MDLVRPDFNSLCSRQTLSIFDKVCSKNSYKAIHTKTNLLNIKFHYYEKFREAEK